MFQKNKAIKTSILGLLAALYLMLGGCQSAVHSVVEGMSEDDRDQLLAQMEDSQLCSGYTYEDIQPQTKNATEKELQRRGISVCIDDSGNAIELPTDKGFARTEENSDGRPSSSSSEGDTVGTGGPEQGGSDVYLENEDQNFLNEPPDWALNVREDVSNFRGRPNYKSIVWKEPPVKPKSRFETEGEYQERLESVSLDGQEKVYFVVGDVSTRLWDAEELPEDLAFMEDVVTFTYEPYGDAPISNEGASISEYVAQNAFGAETVITKMRGQIQVLRVDGNPLPWDYVEDYRSDRQTHDFVALSREELVRENADVRLLRLVRVDESSPKTYTRSRSGITPTREVPYDKDVVELEVFGELRSAAVVDVNTDEVLGVFSPDNKYFYEFSSGKLLSLSSLPADSAAELERSLW